MTNIEQVLKNKIYLTEKRVRHECYSMPRIIYCSNMVYELAGLNIKNSNELLKRLTPFFII